MRRFTPSVRFAPNAGKASGAPRIRQRKSADIDIVLVRKLLREGGSCKSIGVAVGCAQDTVRKFIHRHGLRFLLNPHIGPARKTSEAAQ